jgi:carbon-monoxide dehydrogenase medium subunit
MKINKHWFPASISEAIEILKTGNSIVIAGGTDLIVAIRSGKNRFDSLVDLGRISGLKGIEINGSKVTLGSGVTMTQAEEDMIIRQNAEALGEGAAWMGSPQIRNRATIVGNVISAQPAADTAVPLLAVDAALEVKGAYGTRSVKIGDAYIGVGKSAIDPTSEIVTSFSFEKPGDNEATAYKRMMRRKALTLPILNCASWIKIDGDKIAGVRIALGPVASTPMRMRKAEECLFGEKISGKMVDAAAEIASENAAPRSSYFRGPDVYRKEMVKVIVQETLRTALSRLKIEEFTDAGN